MAVVNASSAIQKRHAYDAYGQVQVRNGSWGAPGASAFGVDAL